MYFGRWTGKGSKVTWKRKVDRLVIPCLKNRHLVWSLVCLWTSGSVLELWNLDSGPFRLRVPWVGLAGPSLLSDQQLQQCSLITYHIASCQWIGVFWSLNQCFWQFLPTSNVPTMGDMDLLLAQEEKLWLESSNHQIPIPIFRRSFSSVVPTTPFREWIDSFYVCHCRHSAAIQLPSK